MSRTIGDFERDYNNEVIVRKPIDARLLVTSINDLTAENTWKNPYNSASTVYNGMLVSVIDVSAPDTNGIYYFFDPKYTNLKGGTTTNSANWRKLCELSELNSLAVRVKALEDAEIPSGTITEEQIQQIINAVTTQIGTDYVKNDESYTTLIENVGNNTAAIASLIATDTDKSIRGIAKDEISTQLKDTTSDLGSLVLRIGTAEEAIKGLQGSGSSATDIYAALLTFEANALIEDSDDIVVDKRQLKINKVGISKLYADTSLIIHGGNANK